MKKAIILARGVISGMILTFLSTSYTSAQYNTAIGIRTGGTSGLTAKSPGLWVKRITA